METRIRNYVDNLFKDIYNTKQLSELKEEISANLLEKVNDYIKSGDSDDDAFRKGVSSLGDMSELIESLKKASDLKIKDNFEPYPLDRKHVLGYVIASAILLFGLMTTGIVYLQQKVILTTVGTLMPFFIVSVTMFVYLGLTQETRHDYGMHWKRAGAYALATGLALLGIFLTGIVYYNGNALFEVLATAMPFIIPSALVFIYLGLTEKSRSKISCKMNQDWQEHWVQYYSNPQDMMLRGNISGALWIFSIAAFFLIGLTLGWKFSWLVFIVAVGCETLIEAYFSSRRKNV